MDLESQVLELLQKNYDKDFTIFEIVSEIYGVKPSRDFHTQHYSKIVNIEGTLNSLAKKGKVESKIVGVPRYAILYQIKKN